MIKSSVVLAEVNELYQSSTTVMGKWMWHNHVQWVADKAIGLAENMELILKKYIAQLCCMTLQIAGSREIIKILSGGRK